MSLSSSHWKTPCKPTIHHRPWPRSPGLKKAIEEDLTEDQSKLTKHRTCLENLLGKDEAGYTAVARSGGVDKPK